MLNTLLLLKNGDNLYNAIDFATDLAGYLASKSLQRRSGSAFVDIMLILKIELHLVVNNLDLVIVTLLYKNRKKQ